MTEETCATCAFRDFADEWAGRETLVCRRYPPRALVMPPRDSHNGAKVVSRVPFVLPSDWCGEYERDETLDER